MGNKIWRKPTDDDKARKACLARNEFENNTFRATWDGEQRCWIVPGRPHILVRVDEVLAWG